MSRLVTAVLAALISFAAPCGAGEDENVAVAEAMVEAINARHLGRPGQLAAASFGFR